LFEQVAASTHTPTALGKNPEVQLLQMPVVLLHEEQ